MAEFVTLFIPFAGTTLGAAMVFLMKEKISPMVEKALLGFAAGVMIAASIWSLLMAVHRHGGGTGKDCMGACAYRICPWNSVSAGS